MPFCASSNAIFVSRVTLPVVKSSWLYASNARWISSGDSDSAIIIFTGDKHVTIKPFESVF